VTAVKDVSLEIADREFVVLVGPSGCGKSTTLRMIAGLEEISKGDIYIGDKRVNDVAPKDRDIAMVFQNYALYPHMSVYDNLAFGLKLRKFPKAEIKKRVVDAASILGIESLLDRKPKALSGGQRQRVAVGRAIVRQPKVFLFDEPLSNLDAKMRVQMRTEITKLHQRLQATMIYVTHDQIEAMTMGDRIVVMNEGIVQQNDAPLTLYNEPVNLFVAGFLGSPPMNFISGTLKQDGEKIRFTEIEGGTIDVAFSATERPAAREFVGKEIVLGIRPGHLDRLAGLVFLDRSDDDFRFRLRVHGRAALRRGGFRMHFRSIGRRQRVGRGFRNDLDGFLPVRPLVVLDRGHLADDDRALDSGALAEVERIRFVAGAAQFDLLARFVLLDRPRHGLGLGLEGRSGAGLFGRRLDSLLLGSLGDCLRAGQKTDTDGRSYDSLHDAQPFIERTEIGPQARSPSGIRQPEDRATREDP